MLSADWRRGLARAAPLAAAYGLTALVGLASLVWARRGLGAAELRSVLGFIFVAALSSGLEPATSRARALIAGGTPEVWPVLVASLIKALAATPCLALVWRISDPTLPPMVLLAGLAPTVVAGFWASDLRVRLDLAGRHAAALWLKQGNLALAFAGAALGAVVGWPPLAWLALATAPRLALMLLAALALARVGDQPVGLLAPLRDRGWLTMALASVLAAVGGSADRIAGLSLLAPGALAGYYLLYELLSRFWVLPYLAAPVLFARHAAGGDSRDLSGRLRFATAALGTAMIGLVALASAVAARHGRFGFGLPLGVAAVAFAAGIVLAALTQLIIAELQGRGAVRRATVVVGIGALVAPPLFFVSARLWGVQGLLIAWLVKSAVELTIALAGERASLS